MNKKGELAVEDLGLYLTWKAVMSIPTYIRTCPGYSDLRFGLVSIAIPNIEAC